MEIRPVGAELFHADGWTEERTDVTKLIVAFRSFANSAKHGLMGVLSVEIIAINGNGGMKRRVTGVNMLVNGEVRQVN